VFHHVVTGEEDAVYADKAYDSKAIRDMLKEADITDRIVFKKKKGKKLRHILKVLNRLYSRVRSGVERIFAHFKGQHGYVRARYKGWDKNQNHLNLMAIMYNMKRAVALSK
jgi:IS5 family transposase